MQNMYKEYVFLIPLPAEKVKLGLNFPSKIFKYNLFADLSIQISPPRSNVTLIPSSPHRNPRALQVRLCHVLQSPHPPCPIYVMKLGSLGDEDVSDDKSLESETTEDLYYDADTQIFDSQFSPSSFYGGEFNGEDADGIQFLLSTQHFDDTVGPEDGFETQVVNLGGETQVLNLSGETQVMMNLGDETQVMNLDGETQLVNIRDKSQAYDILDSFENIDTQLFVDDDTEVAVETDTGKPNSTETSVENEALPDDDSGKQVHASIPGTDTNRCITLRVNDCGQHKAESDASSNEHRRSGSMHRCFTAIRTASIRAFGLAARNMAATKDGNSQSCSSLSGGPYMTKHDAEHNKIPFKYLEEVDQDCTPEEYAEQMQGPRNENIGRVGRPTARKLFSDDVLTENKELNDLPPLSHCDNELAGLSYVESQETGELSQANALNFVDKFLKVNVIDFDQENDIGKSSRWKSDPVSCAKGTQSLAKSANLMSTVGERGVFDWDDNREDEGGGEFYKRKKEVLSNVGGQKRRSVLLSLKTRRAYSKSELVVDASEEKEKQLGIHDRLIGLVSSGSKKELANYKGKDASTTSAGRPVQEAYLRKNLIKELNEQATLGSKDGIVQSSAGRDILKLQDVRFDTQMAAEAIEAFSFGVSRTDLDTNNANQDSNDMPKSFKGQKKNNAQMSHSKKRAQPKRTAKLSNEPSVLSPKCSLRIRMLCDQKLVDKPKRLKADAKEHITSNGREKSNKAPCKVVKKRQDEETFREQHINGIDERARTASHGRMLVKEHCMQEKISTITPVAYRTRQSMKVNKSESDKDASMSFREEMNDLTVFYPKRRRTSQRLSSLGQEINVPSVARSTRSKPVLMSNPSDPSVKRKLRSIAAADPVIHSLGRQPGGKMLQPNTHVGNSKDTGVDNISVHRNRNTAEREVFVGQASNCSSVLTGADGLPPSERKEVNAMLEGSTRKRCKPSTSACTTPVSCTRPVKEASPICMGDEYLKHSCKKSSNKTSTLREMDSLVRAEPETVSPNKDSRRRRDMSDVKVLFSRHVDGDIIKQQKKILSRLGASEASSISEATHFIADEFVRTKNMLEAITFGKPIVTHLWLESCGKACCHIDEKTYVLRDAKKEKEFGFNLPVSLAHACQHPLLQGQRVLITPNTKPGKEILSSLVKAVHGLALQRIGRMALKDNKLPDNLLVLSCEEDYAECVPFLERGAAVYSSELLLNGIVTQRLEYERYRLFTNRFKRTRSTIWLRKDTNQYHPVTKCK